MTFREVHPWIATEPGVMVAVSETPCRRRSEARVGFHPSPWAPITRNAMEGERLGDGDGRKSHVNRAVDEQCRRVPEF